MDFAAPKRFSKENRSCAETEFRRNVFAQSQQISRIIKKLEIETRRVNELASTIELNNAKACAMDDFHRVLMSQASQKKSKSQNQAIRFNTPTFLNDKDKRLYNAVKTRIKVSNDSIKAEEDKLYTLLEKGENHKSMFIDIFDSANEKAIGQKSGYETIDSSTHFSNFVECLGLFTRAEGKSIFQGRGKLNVKKCKVQLDKNHGAPNMLLHCLHKEEMKLRRLLLNHKGSSMWDDEFKRYEATKVQNKQTTANPLDNILFQIYYKQCENTCNIIAEWINRAMQELNLSWHGNSNESPSTKNLITLFLSASKLLNNEIKEMSDNAGMYQRSNEHMEMIFCPQL